jgi:hypothetical protein
VSRCTAGIGPHKKFRYGSRYVESYRLGLSKQANRVCAWWGSRGRLHRLLSGRVTCARAVELRALRHQKFTIQEIAKRTGLSCSKRPHTLSHGTAGDVLVRRRIIPFSTSTDGTNNPRWIDRVCAST